MELEALAHLGLGIAQMRVLDLSCAIDDGKAQAKLASPPVFLEARHRLQDGLASSLRELGGLILVGSISLS